jgi:hypothetical protein
VEFQCRLLSSAVAGSCCSSVENIPFQAERHSGKATKTVRLATGMAFTFTTEYCSDSQRNGVRLQTGIAFIFDRIPQLNLPLSRDRCDRDPRNLAGSAIAYHCYSSFPYMSSTVALFLCQGRMHLTMAYLLEHPHEGQERIFGSPILEDYFGPHSCRQ